MRNQKCGISRDITQQRAWNRVPTHREKALESSSEPLARAERRWGNVEGWGMYEGPEPGGAERRMDEDEDEGAGVVKMKVRVWLLDDVDAVVQKVFSRLVYR